MSFFSTAGATSGLEATWRAAVVSLATDCDDDTVLVLYGDVPLIDPDTLTQLIAGTGPKAMSLLTVMLADPYSFSSKTVSSGTSVCNGDSWNG